MKKIVLSALILTFLFAGVSFAQQEESAPKPKPTPSPVKAQVSKSQSQPNSAVSKTPAGDLVDLDMNRSLNRLEDLERRVSSIERNDRYTDDRLRSMDRDVDDIKRRMRGI
jgi:hypothetical protein